MVSGPNTDGSGNVHLPIQEAYSHLDKRAAVLSGLAISGGEPLLSPALSDLVKKGRSLGLAVKIDTNGTLPDRLKTFIDDIELRPDMISIDIKTSPARYGELTIEREAGNFAGVALLRSLAILKQAAEQGLLRVEYRTVLVPDLVGETEIREIGELLPKDADWQLAPFIPGDCLDPAWNSLQPYSPKEMQRLLACAKSLVPETNIR